MVDFSNKNILIVGLGIMGGSIAKALVEQKTGSVWGVDSNPEIIKRAKSEGVITDGYTEPTEFLNEADFVVVCLYPQQAIDFINSNIDSFKSDAVITDICGVKKPIVQGVKVKRSDIDFVPAHPMAGRERQGYDCSFAELFSGCNYIITPTEKNSEESIKEVSDFAKILGAKKIVISNADEHDELIAYTSQIPHALAVAYMHASGGREVTPFAGGSFRDVSRVALINEIMWTELFSQNKQKLVDELKKLSINCDKLINIIESDDKDSLRKYMKQGAQIKENYDAKNNS